MLPEWSKATPDGPRREALDARPPSPSGPRAPVPTGVVSLPVGLTLRTAPPANAPGVVLSAGVRSETYSEPPADATPHGIMATLVALAGPPTPPRRLRCFPRAPPGSRVPPGCPQTLAAPGRLPGRPPVPAPLQTPRPGPLTSQQLRRAIPSGPDQLC